MASTRLVRKAKRNRAVSRKRVSTIKRLTTKPVIKKVDVEQIKEEFANAKTKPAAKKEAPVKEEAPKAAPKVEKKEAAPKAEKKETAKKPAAEKAPEKKAAPKAEKKEAAPKAEKKEDKAE